MNIVALLQQLCSPNKISLMNINSSATRERKPLWRNDRDGGAAVAVRQAWRLWAKLVMMEGASGAWRLRLSLLLFIQRKTKRILR